MWGILPDIFDESIVANAPDHYMGAIYSVDTQQVAWLQSKVPGDNIMIPRFQRGSGKWKDQAKYHLLLSSLVGIPIGAITVRKENSKLYIIDGRQRFETLKEFTQVGRLEKWVKEEFNKVAPLTKDMQHEELLYESLRRYLNSKGDDRVPFNDLTKPELKKSLEKDYGQKEGQDYTKNLDKLDLLAILNQAAYGDLGSPLEEGEKERVSRLLDLMCLTFDIEFEEGKRKNKSKLSGTFNCFGAARAKKIWPSENRPSFFKKDSQNKWRFDEPGLSEFLYKFYRDCNENEENVTEKRLVELLSSPSGTETDILEEWLKSNKVKKEAIINYITAYFKLLKCWSDSHSSGTVAIIELTCREVIAMKVFSVINQSGTPLDNVELLAAWPQWNKEIGEGDLDDAVCKKYLNGQVKETVDKLHSEKDVEGGGTIVKWDICATVLDRVEMDLFW